MKTFAMSVYIIKPLTNSAIVVGQYKYKNDTKTINTFSEKDFKAMSAIILEQLNNFYPKINVNHFIYNKLI